MELIQCLIRCLKDREKLFVECLLTSKYIELMFKIKETNRSK